MKVSEHVIERAYGDGEFVFMPGDDENHIFLVKEGEVEIYEANPDGKKIVMDRLVSGDIFGLTHLRSGMHAAHRFARVHKSAELCILPKAVFLQLVKLHPEVALRVIEEMSERLETLEEKVRDMALFDATRRVLHELERLAKKQGEILEDRVILRMHLTHEALAHIVGVTRETITKTLNFLKQKGVIAEDASKTLTIWRKKAENVREFFEKGE